MGTLTVPSDADYPPFEFLGADGKTITGLAADLMSGVMGKLGLKYKVQVVAFESIIPGIQANRYQLSLAAENVTPERAKVVDFVTYDRGGDVFYGTSSNSLSLSPAYSAVCGHTVAVLQGSSQESSASEAASSCPSGKAAHVLTYSTQNAVNLALQANRADFGIGSSATIGYLTAQTQGKFKTFSKPFNYTSVTGFAVKKGSGLAPAIRAALKDMIVDGSYAAIFKKWGQAADAISNPQLISQ
jgi:polar amino acid transport system substrate-binding protein